MSMPERCVLRPVLASGMPASNSAEVEDVRRFLQPRLVGAHGGIALETGKTRGRVDEELEGAKVLSLDTFIYGLPRLSLSDRLRLVAHLVNPLGLVVYATAEHDGSLPVAAGK